MLYINEFIFTFLNCWSETENSQTNREADLCILYILYIYIFIYHWICLNKLYKLMESFFKFLISFEFLAENQNFIKRIAKLEYWSKCNVL